MGQEYTVGPADFRALCARKSGAFLETGSLSPPLAHRTAGTLDTGTVRVSFSAFNTPQEADRLAEAVGDILRR